MTAVPLHEDWVRKMNEAAMASMRVDAAGWANAERAVQQAHARMDELGERVEASSRELASASALQLKQEVIADIHKGNFAALNRRRLRVAAGAMFELPIARLKELVAARPEIHAMLLEAFCNCWTERRGHHERQELARLAMGAPPGGRLLRPGYHIDLNRENTPALLADERVDLAAAIEYLHEQLGCRPSWQFTLEAVAAWIEVVAARRGASHVWSQLRENPRVAKRVLPALEKAVWFDGCPSGGGAAPIRTQVTVVASLLRSFIAEGGAVAASFIEKLLRSSFGDPRVLPLSRAWRELQIRYKSLFDEFCTQLVKEDLALFFRHAMHDKERETFWLRYLGEIRRTIPVLSNGTHAELKRNFAGTEQGKSVLARTRRARTGQVSAFCLVFDKIVVVEFSDTGNAAYLYPAAVFEQVYSGGRDIAKAVDLKRTDVSHERLLHGQSWQVKAMELLQTNGVSLPRR